MRRTIAPYVFLAPFFLVFSTFMAYPFIKSIILSFHQTYGPGARIFVGLGNFKYMLSDPAFYVALWNTSVFAFFSVFLQLPLALGMALLLSSPRLRGRNFFRFVMFSPHLLGQVFVGVMFMLLYAQDYGLVNLGMQAVLGWGKDLRWLNNESLVMPALVLAALWLYTGFNMIYFLAALQSVNRTLYDAAQVDGANYVQQFLHVTAPAIRPVATFVVIMSTIGSYKLFELPYILLTQTSGPNQSGLTIVMYLYQMGFDNGDLGYASAIGWMLVLIILAISLVQLRVSGTLREEG